MFISYTRADATFALKLASTLRERGVAVWIDQLDIRAGDQWDRSIETALRASDSVLVILTPESVDSTNVMDEISFALDEKKRVIPILYRPCQIPFRLRRLQHVDFSVDYDRGVLELLRALQPAESAAPRIERITPPKPVSPEHPIPPLVEQSPTPPDLPIPPVFEPLAIPPTEPEMRGPSPRPPATPRYDSPLLGLIVGAATGVAAGQAWGLMVGRDFSFPSLILGVVWGIVGGLSAFDRSVPLAALAGGLAIFGAWAVFDTGDPEFKWTRAFILGLCPGTVVTAIAAVVYKRIKPREHGAGNR